MYVWNDMLVNLILKVLKANIFSFIQNPVKRTYT